MWVNIDCGVIGDISGYIRIRYHFKKGVFSTGTFDRIENKVFSTKDELIESLRK